MAWCVFFTSLTYLYGFRDDEESSEKHGHITSLAVCKNYRRLGLAERLMRQAGNTSVLKSLINSLLELSMVEVHDAHYITLHVRTSNKSALSLYENQLKFR